MNPNVLGEDIVAYAYAYGRVSGMEPKILKSGFLESVAAAKTMGEALSMLESAGYGLDVQGIESKSHEGLETRMSKAFRRAFEEVLSMIPDGDAESFRIVFHGEWDALNIKTVVRRIHLNDLSRPDENALTPLGSMDRRLMDELSLARNTEDLYSKLPQRYRDLLKDSFIEYSKEKKLFVLENRLDSAFVSSWLKQVSGSLRDYVKLRVDSINIMSAVKCRKAGISPRDYFVWDGFYLNARRLAALADQNASLSEALADTPYARIVRRAEDAATQAHYIDLEAALRNFVSDEVSSNALRSPLSVYSVMRFIEFKVREYRMVRAVLLGKHAMLAPEDLRRILSWLQGAS